jgi:DNA repair protein RadC
MPSQKDRAEAHRVREGLHTVGVNLSDFIIAGEDGETYSLAYGGLLF